MTTDVLKVEGNYLVYAPNGDITLNVTSPTTTGTVRIIGNLDILGQTTQIESTSSLINDNIIVLNANEPNNYITLDTSGIAIDRGSNTDLTNAATFLYVDSVAGSPVYWTMTSGSSGTYTTTQYRGYFELKSESHETALTVAAIRTNSPTGTLNLLGSDNPGGMLNVKGAVNYASRVIDSNDIPNKDYVDNAVYTGTVYAKKLQVGNSFVELNDNSVAYNDPFYASQDRMFVGLGSTSTIVLDLTANGTAKFSGLTLDNQSIKVNSGTNNDITLIPSAGKGIILDGPIKLQAQITTFTATNNYSTIYYTSNVGGGGTGLHFVNTKQSDELVSRRKAIIYGIIF